MIIATSVNNVLDNLSFTEREITKVIVNELAGKPEAQFITSSLAKEHKLTRSCFTNTLRLLSCAGILYTRSLGMKGQYVKVINQDALEMLVKA